VTQMALPLRLADHAVFESYFPGENAALVAALRDLATADGGQGYWIWGPAASGKTHLLQATCERVGDKSVYVPLRMLAAGGAEILDGLASRELICIDDIETVAGDAGWEQALFALCNEVLDTNRSLVVSAAMSSRECPIDLPDLQSRLARLANFQLQALSDEDRIRALQLRAELRGLDLPDETAQFLLKRSRRDMASLYELLDKLDLEALRAQRRLTIPFVKEVLG
jgi:DnaA-homolog protein